jgi:hypothetical protein
MLNKQYFKLDLDEHRTFTEFGYTDLELLDRIKHGVLDYSFSGLVDIVEKQMQFARVENNTNHEQGLIKTFMNPEVLREIDYKIGEMINTFDSPAVRINYDMLFYSSLENGVTY